MDLKALIDQPITFNFQDISDIEIQDLKNKVSCVELREQNNLKVKNSYYKMGLSGTAQQMYIRQSVHERLNKILSHLAPEYGLVIFDGFRSQKTQLALFQKFYKEIKDENPYLTEYEIIDKTKQFVAHPDEDMRFAISPHNSGGAIDLAIYNTKTDAYLDFGCPFDDLTDLSKTDFFEQEYDAQYGITEEQWYAVRSNRRLLFNLFRNHGFVNYRAEWWHYDLGDCVWANEHNTDWIYSSMEQQVLDIKEKEAA